MKQNRIIIALIIIAWLFPPYNLTAKLLLASIISGLYLIVLVIQRFTRRP